MDMSAEFTREVRYIVIKLSDLDAYAPAETRQRLLQAQQTIDALRVRDGKPPLECVVVERGWQEYADTWAAIERRVRAETCEHRWLAGPEADAPEWTRDDEITFLTLLLVGGHGVTEAVVATWTDEQCREAEDWAVASHLHASDHDDVVVPPMPAHVAAHSEIQGAIRG